jgi:SAM-dependent methyltransferase
MSPFADAKQRFSDRVADYIRYRPSYPPAVLDLLRSECDLRPGHTIADIGSGTGLLSELFLKNGNAVCGVEPNQAMREAGEEYLASYDGFTSLDGSAESTTLDQASIDFVTAGQSFHWFEPLTARCEFLRILKPGGWLVVVWNERQTDTPFARAYEHLLVRYGTDYTRVRDSYPESDVIREFFGSDDFAQYTLPNAQNLDETGLAGRLRSSSYAPPQGHPSFNRMMAELQELFRENQQHGQVRFEYATHVYFGHLAAQE